MSEQYQVQITARAARDLERLPEKVATACVEIIFGSLVEKPKKLGKPLRDELAGLRYARRGDYRVIYALIEANRRIEIVHVGRRSDLYR